MQVDLGLKGVENSALGADKWGPAAEVLPVSRENFCAGYCRGGGAAVLCCTFLCVGSMNVGAATGGFFHKYNSGC